MLGSVPSTGRGPSFLFTLSSVKHHFRLVGLPGLIGQHGPALCPLPALCSHFCLIFPTLCPPSRFYLEVLIYRFSLGTQAH